MTGTRWVIRLRLGGSVWFSNLIAWWNEDS
jgi:hypothetical protein